MTATQQAYRITPCGALCGELTVQGSKNALLPILAACVLRPGRYTLSHVPCITDLDAFIAILCQRGCTITRQKGSLVIDSTTMTAGNIPPELMQKTRGSFLLLGGMLARFGVFSSSLPGGCRLGKRPIDFHIHALQQMGAVFESEDPGKLSASCNALTGSHIRLPFASVGATQNILIAACGAEGKTVLANAAIEPEVDELVCFLNKLGYRIEPTGEREFTVYGDRSLSQKPTIASFALSADRIAAVTYLAAAAATGGTVTLHGISADAIANATDCLQQAGCSITSQQNSIRLLAPKRLCGIGQITTAPHPGFATDMQPPFMGMLVTASGISAFTETIFENRFCHAAQLMQMGADILLKGKTAVITGVTHLIGRELLAVDLRGGAALTIAALSAEGESLLTGSAYIARGYEDFFGNLNALGANIKPA